MTTPQEINQVFKFCSHLYISDIPVNIDEMNAWFLRIDLPRLSSNQVETWDAPITEDKVRKAIKLMKSGKAPGSDGFPVEYYKKCIDIPTPILTKV